VKEGFQKAGKAASRAKERLSDMTDSVRSGKRNDVHHPTGLTENWEQLKSGYEESKFATDSTFGTGKA
jgi:hypothetical protein